MSSKHEKKRRKEFRKEYAAEMRGKFDEAAEAQRQSKLLAALIKPKPRWMPAFVYWWCFRVVFK